MSKIEWTDATWNPVTGCEKVSPGCAHCYAETVADRFWATQYPQVEEVTKTIPHGHPTLHKRPRRFTDVQCHPDRLDQPLKWRAPRRVFVNSMSDLFHEDVPDAFIDQVFAVMAAFPQHAFQVLTKRPERMRVYFGVGEMQRLAALGPAWNSPPLSGRAGFAVRQWPLPNVWLGVSVEDQQRADERIPILLETPAAVRFVSYEPALGPVDLSGGRPRETGDIWDTDRNWLHGLEDPGTPFSDPPAPTVGGCARYRPPLDWVIVGGESGRRARSCNVSWLRSVVAQCRAAEVPVFVKQLGASPYIDRGEWNSYLALRDGKGGDMSEWPDDVRVREYPQGG